MTTLISMGQKGRVCVAGLEHCGHGADPRDVGLGVVADLELEPPVALCAIAVDPGRHFLGRLTWRSTQSTFGNTVHVLRSGSLMPPRSLFASL